MCFIKESNLKESNLNMSRLSIGYYCAEIENKVFGMQIVWAHSVY